MTHTCPHVTVVEVSGNGAVSSHKKEALVSFEGRGMPWAAQQRRLGLRQTILED